MGSMKKKRVNEIFVSYKPINVEGNILVYYIDFQNLSDCYIFLKTSSTVRVIIKITWK